MRRPKTRKPWRLITAGVCLLLFLAAGRLHLIRMDGLALAACPLELTGAQPDGDAVILQYKGAILAAAQRHDLPPEVLAAIIRGHQPDLTPYRRFTDCAGAALGADVSLGPAQVRITTAAGSAELSPAEFAKVRTALLQPESNIDFQAQVTRELLDRDNRFPGITAEDLIRNPRAMAILMSEYRAGRRSK